MTLQTLEPPEIAHRSFNRLTVEEAAQYVRLSVSFLNRARLTGDGPAYLKLGRRVVYETTDLDHWLGSRRRRSTSEAA